MCCGTPSWGGHHTQRQLRTELDICRGQARQQPEPLLRIHARPYEFGWLECCDGNETDWFPERAVSGVHDGTCPCRRLLTNKWQTYIIPENIYIDSFFSRREVKTCGEIRYDRLTTNNIISLHIWFHNKVHFRNKIDQKFVEATFYFVVLNRVVRRHIWSTSKLATSKSWSWKRTHIAEQLISWICAGAKLESEIFVK